MSVDDVASIASRSTASRFGQVDEALWASYGLRPSSRLVRLSGSAATVRVLEVGSGSPVLLVHGTVGPGSWPSLISTLGNARFIVLERPGWGQSDMLDVDARDYRHVAADLLRDVLDDLGIERASVIGGSIGNVWALSLAEHHRTRVERIVLLGGGPLVADVPPPSFIRLLASPLGALIVRLPVSADRTRSILRDSGHGPSLVDGRIPDTFIDWRVALTNDTHAMRHERDMVRRLVRGARWRDGFPFEDADLSRIDAPTRHIFGTADPVGGVATWRRMSEVLPQGELAVVDGAGHMPWFDDPVRVASLVDGFLGGVAS